MKTLGVLGGMSWESTAVYYKLVNQGVAQRLGGLHSARLLLHSVDFAPMAQQQAAGDWTGAAQTLADAALGLRAAGAQAIVLATNTMHKVADTIEAASGLPLLHIADPTASALRAAAVQRVALLGTRFTMEDPSVVIQRFESRHGLTVQVPNAADRALMHAVIYDELCKGLVRAESRAAIVALIARQADAGAQAVILGCTEISMLIAPGDITLPSFDTTALHAQAAVDWILAP
jgi:aspartate racemase